MLDSFLLRNKIEVVSKKLMSRGFTLDISKLRSLQERRKVVQFQTETLQAERKLRSRYIGQLKARGKDIEHLCLDMRKLDITIDKARRELKVLLSEINNITLTIPNLPDDSVPIGKDENDNVEIKRWGTPRKFNFEVCDHVTLGEMHDGLDFITAVKLSGSRFVVMKGQIAHLYRILTQFMLDLHIKYHGYSETYVPYLVNENALYGTGQLMKFASDLFYVHSLEKEERGNNYVLIPTAEVPLINIVSDKIFNEDDLPIKLTAHSPCFRSEAGSYGSDNRGLIRMHQFDKVELIQIVHPEDSMRALEEITEHAEKVLELLSLPYRRMEVCTGDIGFAACKAYDLEVWIPAQNTYREISSCSNVWDFQARRLKIRYRSKRERKYKLVHTLNGSALAVGRTLIAVLENNQQADGRIKIPEVLRPYMKGQQYIG